MDRLSVLAVAAAVWLVLHAVVAGSGLRWVLARRLGERAFRALFALLSIAALSWLVIAYRRAPCAPLWITPRALLHLPAVTMPLAFFLFAGSFMVKNPTAVAGARALGDPTNVRGVLRITRHPFLWAVALWAFVHLVVNGNVASLLFFGTLFVTAVVGTRDIDRKRMRTHPALWKAYLERTSNVPFAAVLAGRNELAFRELAAPLFVGALFTAILLAFHQTLFHVRPLP